MRKKRHEEHVNNERWLVSYADFITLLFAFFTSLYAISTVDARKAGKMVFSTRAAFNMEMFKQDKPVLGMGGSGAPSLKDFTLPDKRIVPASPKRTLPPPGSDENARRLRDLAKDLSSYVDLKGLQDKLKVHVNRQSVVVSMAAAAFFKPGGAEIRSDSLPVLNVVAERLLSSGYALRVEGHTDDQQVSGGKYASNWDLSTARAVRVVQYLLEEFAYPASYLSAAGYSSYRPVASNADEAGRAANRRVDLVLEHPKSYLGD